MRQATNFQLNADNIPVVVSNNCLQNKQTNKQTKKPRKKTNQNPGADCIILWS